MTGTATYAERRHIIHTRPCPFCGANNGQPCWSRLLGREMENQVHDERRKLS
jgi:hypothetical protein